MLNFNEVSKKIMIVEILENEKEKNDMTWEDCVLLGIALEKLSKKELQARYFQFLLKGEV